MSSWPVLHRKPGKYLDMLTALRLSGEKCIMSERAKEVTSRHVALKKQRNDLLYQDAS